MYRGRTDGVEVEGGVGVLPFRFPLQFAQTRSTLASTQPTLVLWLCIRERE